MYAILQRFPQSRVSNLHTFLLICILDNRKLYQLSPTVTYKLSIKQYDSNSKVLQTSSGFCGHYSNSGDCRSFREERVFVLFMKPHAEQPKGGGFTSRM